MTPFDVDTEARLLFERFMEPDRSALERLLTAAGIQAYLDAALPALAKVARDEEGHSWADVGEVLQITRQAAFQRLGKQPFRYYDGKGGMRVVDPESPAYRHSLEEAYAALKDEPGREADAAILADYLAGRAGEAVQLLPVPIEEEIQVVVEKPVRKKARAKRPS
ncbi:MAG TPA: hypothetical protein VHD87_16275 [Acidimicrobiales bacterium]|nr:hypothetical protein [Acidimicrobiales bacterium]